MKVVAAVLARMGSSRLFQKPVQDVNGRPLLGLLLSRLKLSRKIDHIVVATSCLESENPLVKLAETYGVGCFQGAESDVTQRLVDLFDEQEADVGVVIYGDCPLIDPSIVDEVISQYFERAEEYDFVGNDLRTTYPPGMEVEVFSVPALSRAAEAEPSAELREHGTLVLRHYPKLYRLYNVSAPEKYHRSELTLEVDEDVDLQAIRQIDEYFAGRSDYSLDEIITLLDDKSSITELTRGVERRWAQYRQED